MQNLRQCERCHGKGYTDNNPEPLDDRMQCGDCDGSGIVDTGDYYSPGFAAWIQRNSGTVKR